MGFFVFFFILYHTQLLLFILSEINVVCYNYLFWDKIMLVFKTIKFQPIYLSINGDGLDNILLNKYFIHDFLLLIRNLF
jgi:hypothetical protein